VLRISTKAIESVQWLNQAWDITPELYCIFGSAVAFENPRDLDILVPDPTIFKYLCERFVQYGTEGSTGGYRGFTLKIPAPFSSALPIDITARIPVDYLMNRYVEAIHNEYQGLRFLREKDVLRTKAILNRAKDQQHLQMLF